MKKPIVAGCCSMLAFMGLLSAEENGAFAGVSYQSGQAFFKQDGGVKTTMGSVVVNDSPANFKRSRSINGAGIKVGYKQFFGQSKSFGLRYYGFLDYGYVDFGKGVIPDEGYHASTLSYGVGIDVLWNVIEEENASFGVFAGVGIGADTWIANGKDYQKRIFPNGKAAYANFQTTIDVGLRTNFHKNNGIEIGVKIPLLQARVFQDANDESHPNPGMAALTSTGNLKTDLKRDYSIYVSYLYSF